MNLTFWLVVAAAIVALFVLKAIRARLTAEEAQQIRDSLGRGARLLDVRTAGEFSSGHIEGATNIPVSELATRARELGKPSKPVVVYCQSGSRSARAVSSLRAMGYKTVLDMKSMRNWSAVAG